MTLPTAPRVTPATVLFDDGDVFGPVEQIADQVAETSRLRLVPDGRAALGGHLDEALRQTLDADLTGAPLDALRDRPELVDAVATADAAGNGEPAAVPLGSFDVDWQHSIELEIRLDDVLLATVTVTVRAAFGLTLAAAQVIEHRVAGLDAGACELTVSLQARTTLAGRDEVSLHPLTWQRTRTIEPRLCVPLDRAIRLLPTVSTTAPTRPTEVWPPPGKRPAVDPTAR